MVLTTLTPDTFPQLQELSEEEVLAVSGGHPLIGIAAGVAAGVGIWTAGAKIGSAVGKALHNLLCC